MNQLHSQDIFINLSHLLLCKIIGYLDEPSEKIIITLVCKKLFENRHRIISSLLINKNNTISPGNNNHDSLNNCFLKSYVDIIERSLVQRTNLVYTISSENDIDDIDKLEIPNNVYKLYFESIHELDEIRNLDGCKDLIKKHPHITSIELGPHYTHGVIVGSIPDQITRFANNYNDINIYDDPIPKKLFPVGLESLSIYTDTRQPISRGVLPPSLKYLGFSGFTFVTKTPDVIPATVEEFHFNGIMDDVTIDISVPQQSEQPIQQQIKNYFPMNLHTITIRSNWIPKLKHSLPQLKTIFFDIEETLNIKSVHDFPPSVTHLNFNKDNQYLIPHGLIPPQIKHLDLGSCQYTLLSSKGKRFFNQDHVDMDYLDLGTGIKKTLQTKKVSSPFIFKADLIPKNIKSLTFQNDAFYGSSIHFNGESIPNGVEQLTMGMPVSESIVGVIPSSVRHLTLGLTDNARAIEIGEIPDSVEILEFCQYTDQITSLYIPPSVKKIVFNYFYPNRSKLKNVLNFSVSGALPSTVNTIIISKYYRLDRLDDKNHFILYINHGDGQYKVGFINGSKIIKIKN